MAQRGGHYENWLQKAAAAERAGNLESAIHCLNKAEKHCWDTDELKYLNIWRNRLQSEAAKSSPERGA